MIFRNIIVVEEFAIDFEVLFQFNIVMILNDVESKEFGNYLPNQFKKEYTTN